MRDASVYRRAGRPVWYISFYCPRRLRRVHEATAFRVDHPLSEKRALELAAKRSNEATAAPRDPGEAWSQWVLPFLDDRFRRSPRTLERYKTAWAWILLFITRHKLRVPQSVTYQDLLRFFAWRQSGEDGRAVSRNTAIVELRVWGALLTEAMRRGFIDRNPADRLGLQRDPAKVKPEMTDAEIATIRAGLQEREGHLPVGERWMSNSFEIAVHQGCRLQETAMPLSAIDERSRTIRFSAKARRGRKNEFTTALHKGLLPLIAELRAAGATVTCTIPPSPSREWLRFFREIGLGHLCFHCTRVSVITRLARAGVPQSQAMRFVGHASDQVHRIYQRLRADDLGEALAALAGVAKPGTGQTPGAGPATGAGGGGS